MMSFVTYGVRPPLQRTALAPTASSPTTGLALDMLWLILSAIRWHLAPKEACQRLQRALAKSLDVVQMTPAPHTQQLLFSIQSITKTLLRTAITCTPLLLIPRAGADSLIWYATRSVSPLRMSKHIN